MKPTLNLVFVVSIATAVVAWSPLAPDHLSEDDQLSDDYLDQIFLNHVKKSGMSETGIDIDTNDLPPNFHKTKAFTQRVGGHNVNVVESVDKVTDPKTGRQSVSVVETVGGEPSECNDTTPCTAGSVCILSVMGNNCQLCRGEGERCSLDEHCCGGDKSMLCVSGKCKTGVSRGAEGTICKSQFDCNEGLCCPLNDFVRRSTCRKLGVAGERCQDGKAWGLGEPLCGCARDLVCATKQRRSLFGGFGLNFPFSEKYCQEEGWVAPSDGEKIFNGRADFFDDRERFFNDREDFFRDFF